MPCEPDEVLGGVGEASLYSLSTRLISSLRLFQLSWANCEVFQVPFTSRCSWLPTACDLNSALNLAVLGNG
jgi:hypothetical protein